MTQNLYEVILSSFASKHYIDPSKDFKEAMFRVVDLDLKKGELVTRATLTRDYGRIKFKDIAKYRTLSEEELGKLEKELLEKERTTQQTLKEIRAQS